MNLCCSVRDHFTKNCEVAISVVLCCVFYNLLLTLLLTILLLTCLNILSLLILYKIFNLKVLYTILFVQTQILHKCWWPKILYTGLIQYGIIVLWSLSAGYVFFRNNKYHQDNHGIRWLNDKIRFSKPYFV